MRLAGEHKKNGQKRQLLSEGETTNFSTLDNNDQTMEVQLLNKKLKWQILNDKICSELEYVKYKRFWSSKKDLQHGPVFSGNISLSQV